MQDNIRYVITIRLYHLKRGLNVLLLSREIENLYSHFAVWNELKMDSLTIYFNFYDFVKTQIENSKWEAKILSWFMSQLINQILWFVRGQILNAIVATWNVFLGASFQKKKFSWLERYNLDKHPCWAPCRVLITTVIRLIPDFSTFNTFGKTQIWNYSRRDNVDRALKPIHKMMSFELINKQQ